MGLGKRFCGHIFMVSHCQLNLLRHLCSRSLSNRQLRNIAIIDFSFLQQFSLRIRFRHRISHRFIESNPFTFVTFYRVCSISSHCSNALTKTCRLCIRCNSRLCSSCNRCIFYKMFAILLIIFCTTTTLFAVWFPLDNTSYFDSRFLFGHNILFTRTSRTTLWLFNSRLL